MGALLTRIVQAVQSAGLRYLTDTADVLRRVGTAPPSAHLSDAPCRWLPIGQEDLAAIPGGLADVAWRKVKFALTADVRTADVLVDGTGRRWTVRGTDAGRTDPVYLTVYARSEV